ncbi:MAG: helix-turn-helix domain-containing protein [Paramuribaculum sp.]|nr:helix-turn-helix domain-containing protein [Paramuribaculum sp.]
MLLRRFIGCLSYLSRIVKRISGQTVKSHIDRLLIIEASFMLSDTDESIASIASKLTFADSVSFCKFFIRKKSMTPSEYRTSYYNNPADLPRGVFIGSHPPANLLYLSFISTVVTRGLSKRRLAS